MVLQNNGSDSTGQATAAATILSNSSTSQPRVRHSDIQEEYFQMASTGQTNGGPSSSNVAALARDDPPPAIPIPIETGANFFPQYGNVKNGWFLMLLPFSCLIFRSYGSCSHEYETGTEGWIASIRNQGPRKRFLRMGLCLQNGDWWASSHQASTSRQPIQESRAADHAQTGSSGLINLMSSILSLFSECGEVVLLFLSQPGLTREVVFEFGAGIYAADDLPLDSPFHSPTSTYSDALCPIVFVSGISHIRYSFNSPILVVPCIGLYSLDWGMSSGH